MRFQEKHPLQIIGIGARPPLRLGLLGLVHETNTFAPGSTDYAAFSCPADREPLMRAEALWQMRGTHGVMGGMLQVLDQQSPQALQVVPLYRASAAPSPLVEGAAWQQLLQEAVQSVQQAGPLDALLVEMHGAMVAQGELDCEGALLAAVRSALGPHCPVVVALDFHANVSARMVEHTQMLVPYRTYPHVDMFQTGQRAARRMLACLQAERPFVKAWRQAPFLIPLTGQYTGDGAMADFMAECQKTALQHNVDLALCGGFVLADTPDTGLSLVGYAAPDQQSQVDAALTHLMAVLNRMRSRLVPQEYAADEAVGLLQPGVRSILADVADNPGAGCAAQHLGLLRALHAAQVPNSLVATLNLPAWADAAHRAGVGAQVALQLAPDTMPVTMQVLALSDGCYACQGAMWQGRTVRQGPTARLQWGAVQLIVASHAVQALDPGALACVGVSAHEFQVLALKSSVHYRAAFGPWAQAILHVDAHRVRGQAPVRRRYQYLRAGAETSI